MKVHALLAHERHTGKKAIHEKALAASNTAPEINAARKRRAENQPMQKRTAFVFIKPPFIVHPLQTLDGPLLCRVGDEAALLERAIVDLTDVGLIVIRT